MDSTEPMTTKGSEGLRARKRRETRERIANAAMTLFLERGFDVTTVDDISAAANVSKRSFFDYFPAKEDVVSAWQDEFGDALALAVAARPAREPLAVALEQALTSTIAARVQPRAIAIDRLIRRNPSLFARNQLKYSRLEHTLAEALAKRVKGEAGELRARLLAMIAIGSLRVGGDDWHSHERSESPERYVRALFTMIATECRAFGRK